MIIFFLPESTENTAVLELPEPDMHFDPRQVPVNSLVRDDFYKFEAVVNGTAVTITRVDRKDNDGNNKLLGFRVYSRNEFHYPFDSTKYLYQGIDYEMAPIDATEVVVKDGIETIKKRAFHRCHALPKIIIPSTVTRIEGWAFQGCHSLRSIQLPPNLQQMTYCTFDECRSLEAIYIPPTVTWIGARAFEKCKSLRIINLPARCTEVTRYDVFNKCDSLLPGGRGNQSHLELLRNHYNPFHDLCWDQSVTAENIHQYIQQHHDDEERATSNDKPQFTPLHLLATNPSVTSHMITAYLRLAPDVAIMQDNIGKTPLHMLCSVPCFSDASGDATRAYLAFEEGGTAAFMKDDTGRTPFEWLFEKGFDDIVFLHNQSFAGLMVWWYDCLGIYFFAGGVA